MSGPKDAVLFVYGTLMRTGSNADRLAGGRFLRAAVTQPRYRLLDFGEYPGLLAGGDTAVRGELWQVDAALLARLDEFEDHPFLFARRPVALADDVVAEAYFWADDGARAPAGAAARAPTIAHGDWLSYAGARPRPAPPRDSVQAVTVSPPQGVHHWAVQVHDLPRAERFYSDVLRLPVLRRWPNATGEGERSVWLDAGGGTFVALERATATGDGMGATGAPLVALHIGAGQREAWRSHLAAHGCSVYKVSPYTLYVRDPEGNAVGLSHWPVAAEDPPP